MKIQGVLSYRCHRSKHQYHMSTYGSSGKDAIVHLCSPFLAFLNCCVLIEVAHAHLSICRLHGFLKFQRALSLLGSNLASVGVLSPTAVRAMGSLELGTALGMMR